MSQVITIKRTAPKPPLGVEFIYAVLGKDNSLTRSTGGWLIWNGQPDQPERMINIASDHLWTDDTKNDAECVFLAKLRLIAHQLDARVFTEEGDDITDSDQSDSESQFQGQQAGFFGSLWALLMFIGTLVLLPVFFLWLIVRLVWNLHPWRKK